MSQRRFPVGVQDFEKIITEGFVYVDKTEYIYNLANNYGDAIFLSCAPHCGTISRGTKNCSRGSLLRNSRRNGPSILFSTSTCRNARTMSPRGWKVLWT